MAKRIIALVLLLMMICQLALTSCGKPETPDVENNGDGADKDGDTVEIPSHDTSYTDVPDRFKTAYTIDRAKLEMAAAAATEKLLRMAEEADGAFPGTHSVNYQYVYGANNNWTAGMYTGSYLMAYQLTGDERF